MNNKEFDAILNIFELEVWMALKNVLHRFSSYHKHPNYGKIIDKYLILECKVSVKKSLSRFLKVLGILVKNRENYSFEILKY